MFFLLFVIFFSKIGAGIPLQKFVLIIISSFEIRMVCKIHSLTIILVSQLLVGVLNFTTFFLRGSIILLNLFPHKALLDL